MSFLARILKRKKVAQPGGLISVLTDFDAPIGDRDDAAMDLWKYDEALPVLAAVMSRRGEDENVVDSCADSIRAIFERTRKVDEATLKTMPDHYQQSVAAMAKSWDTKIDRP